MDYSLYYLNQTINFKTLTFSNFVDKLNLIGFEVDDNSIQKSLSFDNDIRIIIKIPPNRADLEIENIFLIELSAIFLFELNQLWKKIRNKYFFLLNQKYIHFKNYNSIALNSQVDDISIFFVEIKTFNTNLISPTWMKEKLKNKQIEINNNIFDVISFVNNEWNQFSNLFVFENNQNISFNILKFSKENSYESLYLVDNRNTLSTNLLSGSQNTMHLASKSNRLFLYSLFLNSSIKTNSQNKGILKKLKTTISSFQREGFQRLLTLLEIIFFVEFYDEFYFHFSDKKIIENKIVKLRKNSARLFLNIDEYNLEIFKKNGFSLICETKNDLYFSIQNFRNDLSREIDLIEEYTKFIGYKNFQEIQPKRKEFQANSRISNFSKIKDFFLSHGFNEILTNPIEPKSIENKNTISLLNPLNNDLSDLRSKLLPKIIQAFELNLRSGFERRNFFEIGRTFLRNNNKILEIENIAGIFELNRFKRFKEPTIEWFIAKGFLENFLNLFGPKNFHLELIEKSSQFFHPTRAIIIKSSHNIIGKFGEINPKFQLSSKFPIYIFEFSLEFFQKKNQYTKIFYYYDYSKYPSIIKDLSFSINKKIQLGTLKKDIKEKSNFLKRIEIFDIYFDTFPSIFINVGIRLEFQSFTQTLTFEIIELELEKIKVIISEKFDGKFRD